MSRIQYLIATCNHASRMNASAKNRAVGSVVAKLDDGGDVITEYRLCEACMQRAVTKLNTLLATPTGKP